MRSMIKELRKGGFAGAKARYNLRFVLGAVAFISVAAVLCVLTGGCGVIAGAAFATAFVIPTGIDFSDSEKKGLEAMANHFTEQFKQFSEGKLSEKEMIEKMNARLKEWADEQGISKEKLEKMSESLKKQGEMLTSLKERGGLTPQYKGLRGAFEKNYDKLVDAIKGQKSGFSIKAVDEHDEEKIQTTANSISSTSGAVLIDSVENNNGLFLKRRGRQYIHDIANVTVVDEVPETYTYTEEGDEDGAIAIVSENGLKPQVHLKLIRNQVNAKKAAGVIVVTEELMKWRSRVWAAIQRLFTDKVWRDYEKLLTTDMITNATGYVGTPLDDTIESPTDFEAVIAAILQLETLNFHPDVLVLNPADKWRLSMTETKNGTFILPYIQNGGEFGLLGLRTIVTTEIEAGTFILGESSTWFIEEEAPQLRTGLVNDDLIHNRMTIVGEIFFLSYVPSNNAGSFIKANFTDIKEALKKPASA